MLDRRKFAAGCAVGVFSLSAMKVAAQSALDALPDGPIREQMAWFIDLLNDANNPTEVDEIASHFTPAFLEQVPAETVRETILQLRPTLGTVEIGEVAPGSDASAAGVQLLGSTGLNVIVSMHIDGELIDGLLIEQDIAQSATATAGTPASSPAAGDMTPEATPEVSSPPTSDEVVPAWQDAVQALTELGKKAIAAVQDDDTETFIEMADPTLAQALEGTSFTDLLATYTSNQVSFTFTEANASFFAQVTERAMDGLMIQGAPIDFHLEPETPPSTPHPSGTWSGQIGPRTLALDIAVTFTGEADALAATLSIPDQHITDAPLDEVVFEQERPIGDLQDAVALPVGPITRTSYYGEEYAWGNQSLVFRVGTDGDDRIIGLSVVPEPRLPADPATTSIELALPFEGAWLAFWGGESTFRNYHAATPQQRHALDLVIWKDGATSTGAGTAVDQYWCFREHVLAPVDGKVVAVKDGLPDIVPQTGQGDASQPAGNHIVIEKDGAYIFLAHCEKDSITVAEGDEVRVGDRIARVGNSGNTSEPHIHIHAQTEPDLMSPDAVSLPIVFTNVLADSEPLADGRIRSGMIIETES